MTHPIFQLEQITQLPLWAQVLLASRFARRILALTPANTEPRAVEILNKGCEALDQAAAAGDVIPAVREDLRRANSFQPTGPMHAITVAVGHAIAAAEAAVGAYDFAAAETALINSISRSLTAASESPNTNPLQARILLAADFDLLRFNCKELGRYDAIPQDVFSRLLPPSI